jgi:phosphate starvation-inducible protein PhoH and related proteins
MLYIRGRFSNGVAYMQTKRKLVVIPPSGREQLKALNPEQEVYLDLLKNNEQVFALGRAGTGKTYMPTALAADMFISKSIKKLVIVRPAVAAGGENLGYLPGDLEEKIAPWAYPVLDILEQRLGKGNLQELLNKEAIVTESLGYMRGRTYNDSMIILDEAQNTTPLQMHLFLTRVGYNSKVVVAGDLRQTDISKLNGLQDALRRNEKHQIAPVVTLTKVERSGLAGKWADAYDED